MNVAAMTAAGRQKGLQEVWLWALYRFLLNGVPLAIRLGALKCADTAKPGRAGKYTATPWLREGYERELS